MTQQELNQRIAIINALADDPQRMYDSSARLYEEGQNVGLFLQGNALSLMGKDKEAFSLFVRYTQLEPDNADGWQYAGMMADAMNETEQALRLLTHAVDMGNMDAACAYASVLVGKGIDLSNRATRIISTSRYEKTNEQAVNNLLEALDIYDFLAQEMPEKLGDGDWATFQNCIGSLYMLAINDRLSLTFVKTKLLNEYKLDTAPGKKDDPLSASQFFADKMEQSAAIMEHVGRKADAAMTRLRQRMEEYEKAKDSQSMQEAQELWRYAMQEADRAFGEEKDEWLAYYEPLKTDYMRLHRLYRLYKRKPHTINRSKVTFHLKKEKKMPLVSVKARQNNKGKKQLSATTSGQKKQPVREKGWKDLHGILKETLKLFRRDFFDQYVFSMIGGLLGGLAQSGLISCSVIVILIYTVGLLVALVGVIKSIKCNSGIREKLIALVIHVIILLLLTFLPLPVIILTGIGAVIWWGMNRKTTRGNHTKVSAQPGQGVGLPRRIFDTDGNVWHRKSSNNNFSTYYRTNGNKEKIYHRTIKGNRAYGSSGIGFRW